MKPRILLGGSRYPARPPGSGCHIKHHRVMSRKLNASTWKKIPIEMDPEEENHYRDLDAKTAGDDCAEVEHEAAAFDEVSAWDKYWGKFYDNWSKFREKQNEHTPGEITLVDNQIQADEVPGGTFNDIAAEICRLHGEKNADYGDSAYESYKEFGIISYVQRIGDKYRRIKNLTLNPGNQRVKTETIEDTLMDLAAYSIMALEAMRKGR